MTIDCPRICDPITVNVPDHEFRAVTHAPFGQRCNCWLPAGQYVTGNVVWLSVDRDSDRMAQALELRRNGELWYVGADLFAAWLEGGAA